MIDYYIDAGVFERGVVLMDVWGKYTYKNIDFNIMQTNKASRYI